MSSWTDRLAEWQRYEYSGMKPGIGRMQRFLEQTGNPHRSFKVIHIAGTNGKGSTARMLAAVLEASGYRTGLYTSPHLVRLHERIQVNSRPIPEKALESYVKKFARNAKKHELTFFEFVTGIAFAYFAAKEVDIAVIETGLGGRYDATNVCEKPELSIITDVDYDHRQILGKTLGAIASEKAGIIKKGRPVISGVTRATAARTIRRVARENGSELREIGRDFTCDVHEVRWRRGLQTVIWKGRYGRRMLRFSLLGEHQTKNCALVMAAIEQLEASGLRIPPGAVERALKQVAWPGRFDVRNAVIGGKKVTAVLDGAHNPGGMRRFAETWKRSIWGKRKRTIVFGVLEDKEYRAMIRILAPLAGRVIVVPVNSDRNAPGNRVAGQWEKLLGEGKVELADSVKDGLLRGVHDGIFAVTGSLYVIGEAIRTLADITGKERRG